LGEDSLRLLYDQGEADAKVAVAAAESLGTRVVQMASLVRAGGLERQEMLAADGAYAAFLARLHADP
jgi:hypothetical protein